MKLKSFKLILLTCISIVIIQVFFINNAFSQSKTDTELVKEVSKFLSSDGSITSLTTKDQYYAFNLKIELFKKNGTDILAEANFSNAIGIQIFPNYKRLNKFDYKSIIGKNNHAIIIVPILILNNPTDEKNPSDLITGINKQSLRNLISSIMHPDILQKDITLFPLFSISRADVQ